jgi:hypothetical protein
VEEHMEKMEKIKSRTGFSMQMYDIEKSIKVVG